MEIKDRHAADDNRFIMWVTGEEAPKLVTLSRSPSTVYEEGTPINKALLQPIVDALQVEQINMSSFFTTISVYNEMGIEQMSVYKYGNIISGYILFSVNISNTTTRISWSWNVQSKYQPIHSVSASVIATDGFNHLNPPFSATIFGQRLAIEKFGNANDVKYVLISFTYLTEENIYGDS